MNRRPAGNLLALVSAVSISNAGTEITAVVVPVIALTSLGASDASVATMEAAAAVAVLVAAPFIGALVDRHNRLRLMIIANLVSFAMMGLAAATTISGSATVLILAVILMVVAVFGALHDVGSETVMPDLVEDDRLEASNSVLNASLSASGVAGPGIGGLLLAIGGAAVGLVIDAVSFLCSALLLSSIGKHGRALAPEPEGVQRARATFTQDAVAGVKFVLGHPILRRLFGSSATSNLFASMLGTVEIIYLVRNLEVPPWGVGWAFSITAIGGIVGGFSYLGLRRWLGSDLRVVVFCQLVLAAPILALPFAFPGWGVGLYIVSWFFYALSSTIYATAVVTYRQRNVERSLLGRVGASSRLFGGIAIVTGSSLGAALVALVGTQAVVLVGSIGVYLSVLWLLAPSLMKRGGAS